MRTEQSGCHDDQRPTRELRAEHRSRCLGDVLRRHPRLPEDRSGQLHAGDRRRRRSPVRITLVQSRGETGYTALAGGFSTSTRQSNDSGPRASTSFGTPAWIRTTTTRGPRPTGCVSRGSATPTATSSRSSRITSDAGLRPAHLPGDERDHRDPGPRVGCANWSVVPVCDIGTDQLQPLVFPHDGQA